MTQMTWEAFAAMQRQDGPNPPAATTVAAKPTRAVAWDARTDRAMTTILFEMAELCSQFRAWKRAYWALDDHLARPELMNHPGRSAAVLRWEKAVDRCSEIELKLWNLAPAAASCWLAYSPARRADHCRSGRWPPPDCAMDEAVEWFQLEWLELAWRGARKQ